MTSAPPLSTLKAARSELVADATLRGGDFCRRYAQAADDWIASLLESATGGSTGRVALIAVGGYGRGELCPGSDLDLVFVHHPRLRNVKSIADAVWYPVWDQGVHLDHSVRTPKDMLAVARDNLKVMLGLLDARLVAGDARLGEQVIERAQDLWLRSAAEMIPQLADAVSLRHHQRGDVGFLLEPDIKEDRGGLRDLHAVHSAAKTVPMVTDPSTDSALREANEVLLAVRVELQRRSDKEVNQLLLQDQDHIASSLDYSDADALMAAVARAGRAIAWASDDCWRRVEIWRRGRPKAPEPFRNVERGLGVDGAQVVLADDAHPESDPSLVFRAAAAAAELGLPMARGCLERLAASLGAVPDPWPDSLLQSLIRLLGAGRAAISEIETLDNYGLMTRLLPEWEAVRNRPQRNALHRFTVDRHLCEAAASACEFVRDVARPDLLLIGALLHDIGKGFPGDHTEAGIEVVAAISTRMGFPACDVDTLVALVRHHLLLADTAARRDLDDPATIDLVVREVGDEELLLLLSALTQADSVATGPATASPWKMRLIRELVARSANRLRGLTGDEAIQEPAADPELLQLVATASGTGRPVLGHETLPDGDGWTIRVAAPDRPGLLANVAGVLALHGLGVRSAQVGAPKPGIATEVFAVAPFFDREPRWSAIGNDIADALEGTLDLEAKLAAKTSDYAGARRPGAILVAEPKVLVDNQASERATVVEVRAPDGIGVLHRITAALLECGLDIVTAKVHTLGHEVVDNFYVRRIVDGTAAKVTHPADLASIETRVLARLGGT